MRVKCDSCNRSAPDYICEICNRHFKHQHNLNKHENTRKCSEKNKIQYIDTCPTCKRVFPEFTCDKCKFAYKYECHLNKHYNRSTPCIKQPKRYICECSLELGSYFALYRHRKKTCNLQLNK